MNEPLTENNFLLFAAKYYDNPQCFDTTEFHEDLARFKYIKRLFNRYEETGELKERLIINHLIVLYNVFGPMTTKFLFYKLDGYLHMLKPFMILLGQCPDVIMGIGEDNRTVYSSDIPMDAKIVNILRKI